MSLDLPNKELHDAIKVGAKSAECTDPVHATAVAIEAFTKGEFNAVEQVGAWFDLQRIKQPTLWGATDADAEHSDLMEAAFQKNNPDARARLIAAIGADKASAAAKAWSLSSIQDFSKPGVRPSTDHVAAKAKGESNPFAPNYKGADRNKAIADYIRKFGTASASRMAASHNATLPADP